MAGSFRKETQKAFWNALKNVQRSVGKIVNSEPISLEEKQNLDDFVQTAFDY